MIAFTLFIGILSGTISCLLGVGGGIIIVPALYTAFPELNASAVVGTSIALIFLNSLQNSYLLSSNLTKPHWPFFVPLSLGAVIGVLSGNFLTTSIPEAIVKKILGIVLIMILVKLFVFKKKAIGSDIWPSTEIKYLRTKAFLAGLWGSLVSGLTGLGGGGVIVPLFIGIFGMSFRYIPLYSNGFMIITTFIGSIGYAFLSGRSFSPYFSTYQIGHVNFAIVGILFLGASIGSRVTVKLRHKVPDPILKKLFITLLVILIVKIFFFS